jgi:hypothetical protein
MKILVETPLNPLSLGNVGFNILKDLHKRGIEVGIFPLGEIDLRAFHISEEFSAFLQNGISDRFNFLKKDIPCLKIWHINGSENRKNSEQYLYTFYECNRPTPIESKIVEAQNKTIFSSSYSRDSFVSAGSNNSAYVPLGFDDAFHVKNEVYLKDVVHFGLMGKFEKRKHTAKIIKTWLKKYGNNNKYQLSCCVNNPFLPPETMSSLIQECLGGKRYTNINFLPRLNKNSEVNDLLNAIDIDLTGLSGAEGWNLPAFNATALGKWSIVLNETAHKDWANETNAILVKSSGEFDCQDKIFFQNGSPFNQGTFFEWEEDAVIEAMEKGEKKVGQVNQQGLRLATDFSYSKTVDGILEKISS